MELFKAEYEQVKTDLARADVQGFTDSVEALRNTQNQAFQLKDDVQNLIQQVKEYKATWIKIQKQHEDVKRKVDEEKVKKFMAF